MTDYTELVKALRCKNEEWGYYTKCKYYGEPSDNRCVLCDTERLAHDAAAAIEALQAELIRICKQLPKRGEWYTELYDGDKKYQCSNCLTHWDVETRYCPYCGAKMDGEV